MEHHAIVFIDLDGKTIPAGRLHIIEDGRFSRSEFSYGRKYLTRPNAVTLDPVQRPLGEQTMNLNSAVGARKYSVKLLMLIQ